ncbi:MAG TPA: DUF4956 domain-containing protein [Candidatus Limiplasma sp.]|nr:DUF4956 domain-containing protein [Candidatus Limiplasma sp.]
MDGALTFQDIIKNSVLEAGGYLQGVTWESVLNTAGTILLSLLMGLLIFWIYRKTYMGVVYSRAFAVSLAGMTVLTCSIIVTIQSNIVLSLGMVGALSIVRYRTAIKDPLDLLYLFWTVATGIAIGAGMFYISVLVFVVMLVLLLIITRHKHKRDEMYILLIHYNGDCVDREVRRALGTRPYQIKSKTMRKQDMEMAVEVRVHKGDLSFVDQIRNLEQVFDLTIVQYDGDYID